MARDFPSHIIPYYSILFHIANIRLSRLSTWPRHRSELWRSSALWAAPCLDPSSPPTEDQRCRQKRYDWMISKWYTYVTEYLIRIDNNIYIYMHVYNILYDAIKSFFKKKTLIINIQVTPIRCIITMNIKYILIQVTSNCRIWAISMLYILMKWWM